MKSTVLNQKVNKDYNDSSALDGGMMKRQMSQHQNTNFIDIESVDKYSSKVQQLGGKGIWETNESVK
jgi:hypothetical protein